MSEIKETKHQELVKFPIKSITILNNKKDECLPIKSLDALKVWKPSMKNHVTFPLQARSSNEINSPKTLVCHDMKGGYLNDRFINGSNSEDNYYFLHWAVIDIFVYFSHHFITIPPCGWISAAHKNGVKILGTFITEWDDGIEICEELLKDENVVDEITTQLVNIAEYYNFDGWLINIENKLQACQVPLLQTFVKILTEKMHSSKINSEIIWYDSVLRTGDLKWQNALNDENRMFFDCCNGIFLNYNWTEETLKQSLMAAGKRKTDVFVGVDVFGRGCPGGGGFCTNIAVAEARKLNLSVAIFAPGWIHECLEVKDFKENQYKFWDVLQNLCPPKVILQLPYCTSFCPGFGKKLFQNGKILKDEPWFNISLQEPQPIYYSDYCSPGAAISIFNEDSYNGGGCICLSNNSSNSAEIPIPSISYFKILESNLLIQDIIVSYTFKPLIPNLDVELVLLLKNWQKTLNLHLVDKEVDGSDSNNTFFLPASKEEVAMKENPLVIEKWIKRVYILKEEDFKTYSIKSVSVTVETSNEETSLVLLGELQILPLHHKLNFTYRNLKFQSSNNSEILVQCTLEWEYHPYVYSSDLFFTDNGEKTHICRTSQFYYDLEFTTNIETTFVELLLSVYCNTEHFSESYLVLPTKS